MEEVIGVAVIALLGVISAAIQMFVRAKYSPQKLQNLSAAAATAVEAAEQVGKSSPEKLDLAVEGLNALGKRLGFRKLSKAEALTFVEAAVAEMKKFNFEGDPFAEGNLVEDVAQVPDWPMEQDVPEVGVLDDLTPEGVNEEPEPEPSEVG